MANKKINELPQETSVASGDLIPIWDASAGTTDYATVADVVRGAKLDLLLLDDFSEANGTNLSGKSLDFGGTWTVDTGLGTWTVSGGKATKTTSLVRDVVYADSGRVNHVSRVTITFGTTVSAAGLVVRCENGLNHWEIRTNPAALSIVEVNGGVEATKASGTVVVSPSETRELLVTCFGNVITAYLDGIYVCSYVSSLFNDKTKVGFKSYADAAGQVQTFDNFEVTAILLAYTTSPGGSSKQLQFHNNNSFGGAAGFEYQSNDSPNVLIVSQVSTHTPLALKGVASQSANLQDWQDGSSNILSAISENGYFTTRKTSAPVDAELVASEMALWLDSTNGAAKLKIKAKQADGTVRTGEVALT